MRATGFTKQAARKIVRHVRRGDRTPPPPRDNAPPPGGAKPYGFWAEITARSVDAGRFVYSWKRQQPDLTGAQLTDVTGELTAKTGAANAAEALTRCVPIGAIVWLQPLSDTPWFIFRHEGFTHFAVRVWQDGGSTDGDKTTQCNRTYTVRTIDATGPASGGIELGTDMTPLRRRPATGKLSVPPASGGGVVGAGYFGDGDTFFLFDANETLDTLGCT